MAKEKENKNLVLFSFIGCWILYATLYMVLRGTAPVWNGVLSTVAIITLDIAGLGYSLWLWKNTKGASKRIFGFFVISCACAITADFIYQLLYNIAHIPRDNIPIFLLSSYNLPTVAFLFFRLLIFTNIAKIYTKKILNIVIGVPIVITTLAIGAMFFLSSNLSIAHFSVNKFYDVIEMPLQMMGFVAAILCLAIAKNKGVFYISIAYILDAITELTMNANILSQSYNTTSLVETLWFLDSLLLVYGLFCLKHSGTYKDNPTVWTDTYNSVKSQTTLWSLMFCLLATGICFFALVANFSSPLSNVFSAVTLQTIATVFMVFTFVFTIGSVLFSTFLYRPLQRLSTLSKCFITEHIPSNIPKLIDNVNYNISEFNEIEAVLRKAFVTMQERNAAVTALTRITSTTAHDVCSPLMALKIALDQIKKDISPKLQQQYKCALLSYEAILKIVKEFGAANSEFKNPKKLKKAKNHQVSLVADSSISICMEQIIDCTLELKCFQFFDTNIQFIKNIKNNEQILCSNINPDYLKRILSNIINNSVEAILTSKRIKSGRVEIILAKEKDKLTITVCDNGCGMPPELIAQLGKKEITTKPGGQGIGLCSAIQCVKSWGGDCKITSKIGGGTRVIIYLPIQENA